jgi:nitrite reductase (NADH) large subunit
MRVAPYTSGNAAIRARTLPSALHATTGGVLVFQELRKMMDAQRRLVVIGNGMVGQRFLERIVGATTHFHIVVLGEEPRAAYDRVQLSAFFSGKSADDLSVVPAGFMDQHGIQLRLNERAIAIDREKQLVRTSAGAEIPYDTLVIATGSFPFVPPIPGRDRPGCFVYRTLEDLEAIRACARDSKIGTVIGGGLLGLEAANALRCLGLDTHVVEFAPRLMPMRL